MSSGPHVSVFLLISKCAVLGYAFCQQLRIDFHDFTLAEPNLDGECIEDVFRITGGSAVPSICGENSGQHGKNSKTCELSCKT
jgi:hypothetical protein